MNAIYLVDNIDSMNETTISPSLSWNQLVVNHRDDSNFRSRTCHIYNCHSKQPSNNPDQCCPCGRLIGRHSLDDTCLESQALDRGKTWIRPEKFDENKNHSCEVIVNVYGALKPRGCKFVRIDNHLNVNEPIDSYCLYHLILEDCAGKRPRIILTISGGAKYFTLAEQLQTEVVRGIIDIAARSGRK